MALEYWRTETENIEKKNTFIRDNAKDHFSDNFEKKSL